MKPKVYVTRHLPRTAWNELVQACEVETWDFETPPPYEKIIEAVPGKVGLLSLLTDRIDAKLIEAGSY